MCRYRKREVTRSKIRDGLCVFKSIFGGLKQLGVVFFSRDIRALHITRRQCLCTYTIHTTVYVCEDSLSFSKKRSLVVEL
jgi:hypothetical protein